jgi:hypothetical protein
MGIDRPTHWHEGGHDIGDDPDDHSHIQSPLPSIYITAAPSDDLQAALLISRGSYGYDYHRYEPRRAYSRQLPIGPEQQKH